MALLPSTMTNEVNAYRKLADNWPDRLINLEGTSLSAEQTTHLKQQLDGYEEKILEIGSGSGSFIIENAKLNPEKLFVGVELRYKRSVRTIEKAIAANVENLIIIRADVNFLMECLQDQQFKAIYINFPDPWDKARWLKHRMFTESRLSFLASLLPQEGLLSLKTDHEEYFESARELVDSHKDFQLTEISRDFQNASDPIVNVKTEFEQLFRSQRKNIYYFAAIRV